MLQGESEGYIVNRARVRRLGATVIVGSLLAIQAFAGSVGAAPPRWAMTVTELPEAVSPGQAAGYEVTVTNNGPSNISALYLNDNLTSVTPVYLVSVTRPGTCGETGSTASGPLFCSFGALTAGASVTIRVAYTTPSSGSSFPITFQANTTGETFSDRKGRSHGDSLTMPVATDLNGNRDYAGFFSTSTGGAISNNANLTGNNKQSTALAGLAAGAEGTVRDGSNTTGTCVNDPVAGINCSLLDGEWAEVNVAGGKTFDTAFQVIMKFKTGGAPSAIFHSFGPPAQQEKIETCATTGGAVPCFTWDSSTSTVTIQTFHNGSYIRVR